MKKVFTFISLLVWALAATAYTGQLIVGNTENSNATATVTQNGDTYSLTVGSYNLTGLTGTTTAGVTTLKQNGAVVARFNTGTLYANFTQGGDNVSFTTAGFQLNNRGFEAWHDVSVRPFLTTYSGSEPNGWHGFLSSNGSDLGKVLHNTAVNAVKNSLKKSDDYHDGTSSALLTAGGALGIVANGTMTTGRMNMGSTSAANTANHAYIDESNTDANGDPFYTSITKYPDAITAWVKGSVTDTKSNMSAILVSSGGYQDPQDANTTYNNIVAKAKNDNGNIMPSSAWQQVSENFDYSKGTTTAAPKYLLLTISTSATPGGGAEGDKLYVDDIYLVYNTGEVTGITCSKFEGFTFDAATTEYNVIYTGSDALTEADITATFDNLGKGAITGKSVEATDDGYRVVVGIYNQELSQAVEYVINVAVPQADKYYLTGAAFGWNATAVELTLGSDGKYTTTQEFAGEFKFVKNGSDWLGPEGGYHAVTVTEVANGTQFGLSTGDGNFSLPAGEWTFTLDPTESAFSVAGVYPLYVIGDMNGWNTGADYKMAEASGNYTYGPAVLPAGGFKIVTDANDAWSNTYYGPSSDKTMTLGNPEYLVQTGSGNYLIADAGTYTITVDPIEMTVTVNGEETPIVLEGVSFTADRHYASYFAGRDLALPNGVNAYTVASVSGDEVTLAPVDYIPAGVGVLLQSDIAAAEVSAPVYHGATQSVNSMLAGSVTATTIGEGYLLYNDEFVLTDGGALAAYRCYLPSSAVAGAPARLRIGKGVMTGVNDINAHQVASVKYVSLDGRVSDKPFAGVNVVVKTLTDGTTSVAKVVK